MAMRLWSVVRSHDRTPKATFRYVSRGRAGGGGTACGLNSTTVLMIAPSLLTLRPGQRRREVLRPHRRLTGAERFEVGDQPDQRLLLTDALFLVGQLAVEAGHDRLPPGDDLGLGPQDRLAEVGRV